MKKFSLLSLFLAALFVLTHSKSIAQPLQLTDLPTVYITTQGGAPIDSKENYVPGTMTVVGSESTPGKYDGPIEIRGRGNSTWFFPKKPYRIKLDSKFNLLGMPSKENKWVLLANYRENTLLRNSLAFEISKRLGLAYSPPYRFVDVYLNNTYIGNYTLTDLVEVGNNRVNIEKLNNTIVSEPDLTGGYFFQTEQYADTEPVNFQTPQANRIAVKYPDEEDINQAQFDYIKNHVIDFENRLFSPQFLDPISGYRPLIDRDSQVKWYIGCELTGNSDSFLSVYMFKKRNDPKIYFGPMWDYDIAFNNYPNFGDATYKRMSAEAYNNGWINRMLLDPEFKEAVKAKWNELKNNGLQTFLQETIDAQAQQLLQSQAKNYEIWPYYTPSGARMAANEVYMGYVNELKTYMTNRVAYLDQQFNDQVRPDLFYKLANRATGKIISPVSTGDVNLVQKTAADAAIAQQWSFVPVNADGITYYRILNRETNQYLTAYNNNVFAQLRTSSDPQNDYQLWRLVPAENNAYYGFINKGSNLAIENLDNQSAENNIIIQLSDQISSQSKQQWTFIPFAINDGALPITISELTAKTEDESIKLTWKVASHINGSHVVIQRTSDPGNIPVEDIGQVDLSDSKSGDYEFIDHSPSQGDNYYRLKKIDLDGSIAFTSFVSADYNEPFDFVTYPVPAQNYLDFTFSTNSSQSQGSIRLSDVAGKTIYLSPVEIQKGKNQKRFEIGNISSGIYNVQFDTNGKTVNRKILVLQK